MDNFSQHDWTQFLYLIAILAFLGIGFVGRKEFPFSKILKYFSIWGAIGMIFIALYSYRFEFSDFKNRILGEVNPSKARIEGGKVVIRLSQGGHFYINLKINGIIVRFMIDTGASDIVLNRTDARKIGVDFSKLRFNKIYQTANGQTMGASTILRKVEINNVIFRNITASVNDANMGTSLLGMSFLRQFKKYEFYQDRLVLTL